VDIVYEAPGTYSFEAPEIPYLFGVKWSGTGVIVDDLQLVALCGCVPNEASSWGMVKAMYR
jgi:hypothetical protein